MFWERWWLSGHIYFYLFLITQKLVFIERVSNGMAGMDECFMWKPQILASQINCFDYFFYPNRVRIVFNSFILPGAFLKIKIHCFLLKHFQICFIFHIIGSIFHVFACILLLLTVIWLFTWTYYYLIMNWELSQWSNLK